MRRHIAIALAGTALMVAPAFAQTGQPASNAPAAQRADTNRPMFQMKQGQWRTSKLIGLSVYNNNNEDVGDINELIVGQDGRIEAFVIGVGGFLGLGEHDVAVPFNQVKFMEEPRRDMTATRTDTRTDTRPSSAPPAANAPANTPPASNNTGTTAMPANRDTNRDTNRKANAMMDGVPDHALVNMSKDQLKALPQVRYER